MEGQPNDSSMPRRQWGFLSPPQEPEELGRLAQYRILKQLGEGGMGVVFQAEDLQLRRLVALKVMRPDFSANEPARARFLREARAAAALKHDHIVTIYQVGEDKDTPFLAMEYLTGKSLEEWLRPDRRASIAETLTIGKQIAKGLAAAHGAGLIHRDIKPANLWLEAPRGRVKILDFGVARLITGEFTALTQQGAMLGTPAFMAPEQARGEVVDPRCDLFSFGCVLYRLVTGRLPFRGSTVYAVLAAITSETPPAVRDLNHEVSPRLADLINRLLAKHPEGRPASARAVLDELQEIEKGLQHPQGAVRGAMGPGAADVTTIALPSVLRRSWVVGIAGLVAIVVGAVAIFGWLRDEEPLTGPDSKPPSVSKSSSPSPVQAVSVDLLSHIDVSRDRIKGQWRLPKQGCLQGQGAATERPPDFGLVLPWHPPLEYRLKLTVTRLVDEPGNIALGLASGSARFSIGFDVPKEGTLGTGLGLIDGSTDVRAGRVLEPGLAVHLVCTVRGGKVMVEANGREIYRWAGDFNRLSRGPAHPNEPLVLGGSSQGIFAFEDIVLEPLGPSSGKLFLDRK